MELLVVCWLLGALHRRRQRTYTAEEIEEIKRFAALREAGGEAPLRLEAPARARRWWQYAGLY